MGRWRMQPGDEGAVTWYVEILLNQSMYVRVCMWQMIVEGQWGMCVAQSTPMSNRTGTYNASLQGTPHRLGMLEWEAYELFWYPNLDWMNWRDLASPNHLNLGMLGEWLSARCPEYQQRRLQGRMTSDGLRACLTSIGVDLVLLGEAGYTWLDFCGVDFCFQLLGPAQPQKPLSTWYVGMSGVWPPRNRRLLYPTDWYLAASWMMMGTKDVWGESDLEQSLRMTTVFQELVCNRGQVALTAGEYRYNNVVGITELVAAAGLAQRMRLQAQREQPSQRKAVVAQRIQDKPRL